MTTTDLGVIAVAVSLVITLVLNVVLPYLREKRQLQLDISDEVRKLAQTAVAEAQMYKACVDAVEESRRQIHEVLVSLKKASGLDRLEHIRKLGDEGERAIGAVTDLLDLFEPGSKPYIRWHVLSSLTNISKGTVGSLITEKALSDSHPSIRAYAAYLAGQLGTGDAKERLFQLLNSPDENDSVKSYCEWALGRLGSDINPTTHGQYPTEAYVMIKAPGIPHPGSFSQLERLRAKNGKGILEAACIHGDYDVLLKVMAPNLRALNELVMRDIQALIGLTATRTFIVINEPRYFHWTRADATRQTDKLGDFISWVLIRVPVLQSGGIILCAEEIPEVVEAAALYGELDVVLKVQAKSEDQKDAAIARIKRIPYTENTQTYRLPTGEQRYYLPPPADLRLPVQLILP